MTADDYTDLARHAEAATRGPWDLYSRAFREHRSHSVKSSAGSVVAFAGYGPDGGTAQANAEFIAAANPATILRLIETLRQERVCYTDECGEPCRSHVALLWAERDTARKKAGLIGQRLGKVRAERDALAARLAAVEALLGRWHEYADPADLQDDLRAALAAPTDTTKEN